MPGQQNSKATLDFLGTIGTKKGSDDVVLNNTAKALVQLGQFLIDTASDNMQKKGNVATGGILSSMETRDIDVNGTLMSLNIYIDEQYKFIDQGVKGVNGGSGKFQFKTKYANKKMVTAIKKWLRVRKVATSYKAISKNERKNQKIKKLVQSADGKLTGLAYAIATNIKKKGIKPSHFFTDAVKATRAEQKRKFSNAVKLDIIQSLNDN